MSAPVVKIEKPVDECNIEILMSRVNAAFKNCKHPATGGSVAEFPIIVFA